VIVLFSHFAHREGESTKLKNLLAKQEYPARAKTSLQSTGAYSELREDKQLSKMTPFSNNIVLKGSSISLPSGTT
jgi:hypothetical protein